MTIGNAAKGRSRTPAAPFGQDGVRTVDMLLLRLVADSRSNEDDVTHRASWRGIAGSIVPRRRIEKRP